VEYSSLPDSYHLRNGSRKDLGLLIGYLEATYKELFPGQSQLSHLAETAKSYFSVETPLWFVEKYQSGSVACLWMGNAIDQSNGEQYGHIFLIYVEPKDRRQGIGTSLMEIAKTWSEEKGQKQIGLHVFLQNKPALRLYENLGFQPQSLLMIKKF
jgi:ribosomal protein S18 acetylase RimI-like enzyme